MTGCPTPMLRPCAMIRAPKSALPPASDVTIRSGLEGNCWEDAKSGTAAAIANAKIILEENGGMDTLCNWKCVW
jgi:hypothetical protein